MSWTKREFVNQAFSEIGFASYNYDLDPEQLQDALRNMDSMVATWNTKGIKIGYPLPSSPSSSSLDTETNVPDAANEAIYLNLAIRLAPSLGKMVSPELKQTAKGGMDALYSIAAIPNEMQITDLPSGAGNKSWRNDSSRFLAKANTNPLQIGEGDNLEFLGDS